MPAGSLGSWHHLQEASKRRREALVHESERGKSMARSPLPHMRTAQKLQRPGFRHAVEHVAITLNWPGRRRSAMNLARRISSSPWLSCARPVVAIETTTPTRCTPARIPISRTMKTCLEHTILPGQFASIVIRGTMPEPNNTTDQPDEPTRFSRAASHSQDSDRLPSSSSDEEKGGLFQDLARELRCIAGSMARRNDTLQPTALVNEAYMKLCTRQTDTWNDKHHFLRSAAKTMRSILIDHKKSKAAIKRGGDRQHHPLDDTLAALESDCGGKIEDVHEALTRLEEGDVDAAEYVNLRFFAGRSNVEACAVLGISERTGGRRWEFARTWLHEQLSR